MGRVHPHRRIFDGQIIDPTDWEECWGPYADLIGGIDEHNLNAPDISTSANLEVDFSNDVFGSFGSAGDVDDDALAAMFNNKKSGFYWNSVPGSRRVSAGQWSSVPGTQKSFLCTGGKIRIQFRVAIHQTAVLDAEAVAVGRPASVKVGVRLDGGVITESVIGGQDTGNEAGNMEQGPGNAHHSQSLEVTVPISSGQHNIEGVIWIQGMDGHPISSEAYDIFVRTAYATIDYRVMTR